MKIGYVHDIPVLGKAAVPDEEDVHALGDDALSSGGHTKPFPHVGAAAGPHGCHLVTVSEHVLESEMGIESSTHHAGALLQALASLGLAREGTVLHMVRPRYLIEDLEPTLVHDLLKKPNYRLPVLDLLLRHLVCLLLTMFPSRSSSMMRLLLVPRHETNPPLRSPKWVTLRARRRGW